MAATLRAFLGRLDEARELHRVRVPVSPILEIAEIADRQAKLPCPRPSEWAAAFDPEHAALGGKALLFERVEGCDVQLAINAFGSYRRMEMALGVAERGGFEAIARRIASLTTPSPPRSMLEIVSKAREFAPLLRTPPKRVRRGRCQEVVRLADRDEVDLRRIPLIKCWPLDGDPRAVGYEISAEDAGTAGGDGRYVTFAGMHTIHAADRDEGRPASHNVGMYRAQLLGPTTLAMHWHLHHDGARHWRSWKKIGKPMPIAIAFGGESVLPYAATAPLPPGVSELLMAGFLNGRGIPMVRAKTVPLRVPANSEIVIEGYVSTECGLPGWDPDLTDEPLGPGAAFEGPFGDHTGFYSLPDRYPIVNVTAVTHARDAVFPATIVGLPPQEDYYLGKATERIFLPLLRTLVPDIEDYHLPMFGCFHNAAFIRIDKAYALQGRRVMHSIWGAGQMAWTKTIVVVDEDVDVHREAEVWRAVFEWCDFARDVELVAGPLDILDHAAPYLGAGHKIGFDVTTKMPGDEAGGPGSGGVRFPDLAATQRALRELESAGAIAGFALPEFGRGRCVFVSINKERAGQGAEAIEAAWRGLDRDRLPGAGDFVIAVGADVDVANPQAVLFHWTANADPGRDLFRERDEDGRPTGRIAFDATKKTPGDARLDRPVRRYPPILKMDDATRALVDRRWGEYGLSRASGASPADAR